MNISFIWFDLGYTLVYMNREQIYQKKLREYGIDKSMEELKLAFHLADKFFMREYPGLLGQGREKYARKYHKVLHKFLRIEELPEMLHQSEKPVHWKTFPETLLTLQNLKNSGFGIGLISNWDHTAKDVLKQTGIFPYLDHVVISSEIQIEKPAEKIFQYALQQAGVSAEECLYVGDNYYDDVVGSRKVGMQSILINPYANKGIEELGDIQVISNIKELHSLLLSQIKGQ
ncbi:HAD-IA family hydrolase [Bacillaceae bacterium Marseille-Q3522]|nr:HAD-IA family hydrolase [Bacillaceae bacterium Marseille-Q3522]